MILTQTLGIELWERAFTSEIGIRIPFEDEHIKRNAEVLLFRSRKEAKNPSLDMVKLVHPGPYPNEIWLVREMVVL